MMSNANSSAPRPVFTWLLLLLALAAACLAVSNQSFWIDEVYTTHNAAGSTLGQWWRLFSTQRHPNLQLPLYMFYAWGWARVFGVSEVALRAGNLPWFFVGLFAIFHFLRRRPGLRNAAALVYCLHPFVWYYVNEARPYHMQLAGAMLVMGALFAALDESEDAYTASWWWLLGFGYFVLCGSGLLGIPWAVAVTVMLAFRPAFWGSMFKAGLPAVLVFGALLVALAGFYAWTLTVGVNATGFPLSLGSSLSGFYEELGFLGLGPGRTALRVFSPRIFAPYLIPVGLFGVALAWGFLVAMRNRFGLTPQRWVSLLLFAGLPLAFVFAFGYAKHSRILGRHLTPFFPVVLAAEAYVVFKLWTGGRALSRVAALVIILGLAVSSLEVRFAFRHSKDDFRGAALAARQLVAQGKTVWWAADSGAGGYYGLSLTNQATPGSAIFLDASTTTLPAAPEAIFLSKGDLYDPSGIIQRYIAAHHFHEVASWQAFTLWEPPGGASAGTPVSR